MRPGNLKEMARQKKKCKRQNFSSFKSKDNINRNNDQRCDRTTTTEATATTTTTRTTTATTNSHDTDIKDSYKTNLCSSLFLPVQFLTFPPLTVHTPLTARTTRVTTMSADKNDVAKDSSTTTTAGVAATAAVAAAATVPVDPSEKNGIEKEIKENEGEMNDGNGKKRPLNDKADNTKDQADADKAEKVADGPVDSPAKRARTMDETSSNGETAKPTETTPAAVSVTTDTSSNTSSSTPKKEDKVLDLAKAQGFKAGDRIEAKWNVSDDEGGLMTRWWGATLKEHDGRKSDDNVAIRVLDYDPYPEGGFYERSLEEVVFVSTTVLVDNQGQELEYRREGVEETVALNEEGLRQHFNVMLMGLMKKHNAKWSKLNPAKQAEVAEVFAKGKEKLISAVFAKWQQEKTTITADDIPTLLQTAFGDSALKM